MFDTLLRGGTVIDGTGRAAFAADIAIEKCSAVGAFVELRYVVVIIVAQIAYLRRSESSHDVITFLTEMIPFR